MVEDVGQGSDESGGGALAFVEQLSTVDMVDSVSQAHLGVGATKGTLASGQILAMDNAFSLLSNIFEHKDLCWASHFLLASSVKGFTPLCLTWAALVGDGLVATSLWIPPEV